MSVFDKLDKSLAENKEQTEKLRLITKGVNLRVSLTKPNYARRFWLLVDTLSAEDRATLDILLSRLCELAEDDSEEITIMHIKDGKKVE